MEKIFRCVKQCGMIQQINGHDIELWILQKMESLLEGAEQFKDDFAIAQFELHLLKEINTELAKLKGKEDNIEAAYGCGPINFSFVIPAHQLVSSSSLAQINKVVTTYQALGCERLMFRDSLSRLGGKEDPLQTVKLRISVRDEVHQECLKYLEIQRLARSDRYIPDEPLLRMIKECGRRGKRANRAELEILKSLRCSKTEWNHYIRDYTLGLRDPNMSTGMLLWLLEYDLRNECKQKSK